MSSKQEAVRRVLDWYFEGPYGTFEGPGAVPFYCDPGQVGHFAVTRHELASGAPATLFRFLIAQAMFQARRDVLIMRQQRAMTWHETNALISSRYIAREVRQNGCLTLASAREFREQCNVVTNDGRADCGHHPGAACHVKLATERFNRVGDMGKLPTSAWFHFFGNGGLARTLREVARETDDPRVRACLLVDSFSRIHRIGRKLATMFVSALSTPALAPGLTPWFPTIDGNELVVVDTNVARAARTLRAPSGSYGGVTLWVQSVARSIELRRYGSHLPNYSPRLVQQALYSFCSKSNRAARADACAARSTPCKGCVASLCPFQMIPAASLCGTSSSREDGCIARVHGARRPG
jgi:hypothetical protein